MQQKAMGFLEHLYRGRFQEELLNMDFSGADEDKVRSFITDYNELISNFKPLDIEKQGVVPDELMNGLKRIGIFGLTIPTQYGGLGFTMSEYLRVVEEMARSDMALVLVPLAHLSIGLKGILLFGTDEQKQKYLTKAASGEMVFAYALTEPKTGSDAQHIDTVAKLSDDGTHYVLNGSKTYITNGNYAGGMTVFAQLDDGKKGHMGAFIVERAWDGITVGKDMAKMGLKVSSTTAIQVRDVRVPKENLLANEGDGFKIAMNILNYGRLGLGAASAGLMKQSLRDMHDRASKRTQFGVPIKSFELIQEKMTRARAHGFASQAMTYFTAQLLEKDPLMNVAIESSHCKLYGTDQCWNTLYDALQTAGGAGFIQTMPYEKRMRDFRVTTIFEGTSEIHSIYPPLTLFRDYGKDLKQKGVVGKFFYLQGLAGRSLLNRVKVSDPRLRSAIATATRCEGAFGTLAKAGLLKHGRDIPNQEYFLRKMTHLSLSLFSLLSSVMYLQSVGVSEEGLAALEYLRQEALEVLARIGTGKKSGIENASGRIFELLDSTS